MYTLYFTHMKTFIKTFFFFTNQKTFLHTQVGNRYTVIIGKYVVGTEFMPGN